MQEQIDGIEIRLESDPLGRKFRLVAETGITNEGSFPCHGCYNAIWHIDHFCCKKLKHGWDEWGEFKGEDVYPFETLYSIAKRTVNRDIEYLKEGVSFYECKSRNL